MFLPFWYNPVGEVIDSHHTNTESRELLILFGAQMAIKTDSPLLFITLVLFLVPFY